MDINNYINNKKKRDNTTIDETYQNYMQMSQEQLMEEMFSKASEARRQGNLNQEMLNDFYQRAQGFLSPEQAERMKELIIQLSK